MSVLRGRPPGFAAGINGAKRSHSGSLRSLGRPFPARRYVPGSVSVHIRIVPQKIGDDPVNHSFLNSILPFETGSKERAEEERKKGPKKKAEIKQKKLKELYNDLKQILDGAEKEGDGEAIYKKLRQQYPDKYKKRSTTVGHIKLIIKTIDDAKRFKASMG